MSEKHGAIWWSELNTGDVNKALEYYKLTCGWSFDEMPMDGFTYYLANHDGAPVAGIVDIKSMPEMAQLPPHWFTYIAVDDVDAAAEATQKAGGKVTRAPFDVEGVGRIAMVEDPSGAAVGFMTPA